MRIACPSCAAEYEVPASRMKPRRMVRCARCGNEWAAVQEAEPAEDDPVPEDSEPAVIEAGDDPEALVAAPAVSPDDRLGVPPRPAAQRAALVAAWIATVAVLIGTTTAAIAWRADVVRAWPAAARLLGPPGLASPDRHQAAEKTAESPPPRK